MRIALGDGRSFDAGRPIDISIPLRFNGPQPNAYGVEPASAAACEYGTLVGDTRRGGSCNFERYSFIPHCNGTHTECVGHITDERISVRDSLAEAFVPATLITVSPTAAGETDEKYPINYQPGDRLITAEILRSALLPSGGSEFALIVRTLPNDDGKLACIYDGFNIPPFFTNDAMQFIVGSGCKHLIVDLPSIDRLFDDGLLANHRIFWNVEAGNREVHTGTRVSSTVTELAFIPESVGDGEYLLNLQIAPFEADCAPSRPMLFRYE